MVLEVEEDFFNLFPDEISCFNFIEKQRWNGTPKCPHCGSEHHYRTATRLKAPELKGYKDFWCKACNKKYTIITRTFFHSCKIPVQKILFLLFCFISGKVNSTHNSHTSNVTQKTSWIRVNQKMSELLLKRIEIKKEGKYNSFCEALNILLSDT